MIPLLFLATGLFLAAPQESPATASGGAPPADAAGLTAELLEHKDDADPELVRRLSNLKTPEALDGLTRFYDAVSSLYMRRIALHGFVLFDGVPEAEAAAMQKLTDIGTLSQEIELRDTAVEELGGCKAGRPFLAAIVNSTADDAVREHALRLHVATARAEDVDWYLGIYSSEEAKAKDAKEKEKEDKQKEKRKGKEGKEERPPEPLFTAPLKELAFEGLAASRSNAELVTATQSGLVMVRRKALEELVARRAPEAEDCAERMLESRRERPDVRLFAAKILLDERGPKFAEKLYKDARNYTDATTGALPLELAFGLADLIAGVDDPGLRSQVVKKLGGGQENEQRFQLRIAEHIPDSKVDKALLEFSKDKSRALAVDALSAMGVRGNPSFVPRLREVLREEHDTQLLTAAIESLARIQAADPAWRAELATLATNAQTPVRNAALAAIGKSKDASQLPVLVAALEHQDWSTRLAAARALEELHLVDGVGALCKRIPKEEGRMVTELADILWRLTAQPFRGDAKQWQRWWDKEGANFVFPSQEEFQKRQRERDLRADKEVSRSFRGVKVESRFFGLRITSHHVAFVIDVSGSMDFHLAGEKSTEGPKRLEVARKELLACIEALEGGTYFNILPFANNVSPWKEKAVECTEATFAEAKEFVTELGALGGTNVYAGMQAAFADPEVDTIFFLSDGEPSVGEQVDPTAIREAVQGWNKERGVVIHTISIGDRFPLLQWLAEDSGGAYRTYP